MAVAPGRRVRRKSTGGAGFQVLLEARKGPVEVSLRVARDHRLEQTEHATRASRHRELHQGPAALRAQPVGQRGGERPRRALDRLPAGRIVLDDPPGEDVSRPIERSPVRTVLPTPIGSGEVSSSVSTLSSQRGRFRASATKGKTSSGGRAISTETLLVNTSLRAVRTRARSRWAGPCRTTCPSSCRRGCVAWPRRGVRQRSRTPRVFEPGTLPRGRNAPPPGRSQDQMPSPMPMPSGHSSL